MSRRAPTWHSRRSNVALAAPRNSPSQTATSHTTPVPIAVQKNASRRSHPPIAAALHAHNPRLQPNRACPRAFPFAQTHPGHSPGTRRPDPRRRCRGAFASRRRSGAGAAGRVVAVVGARVDTRWRVVRRRRSTVPPLPSAPSHALTRE
jgi:hypothetical protein